MIGERLNTAINDQIKNELESYYIYLSAWGTGCAVRPMRR
jgi:ferritin